MQYSFSSVSWLNYISCLGQKRIYMNALPRLFNKAQRQNLSVNPRQLQGQCNGRAAVLSWLSTWMSILWFCSVSSSGNYRSWKIISVCFFFFFFHTLQWFTWGWVEQKNSNQKEMRRKQLACRARRRGIPGVRGRFLLHFRGSLDQDFHPFLPASSLPQSSFASTSFCAAKLQSRPVEEGERCLLWS